MTLTVVEVNRFLIELIIAAVVGQGASNRSAMIGTTRLDIAETDHNC